MVGNEITCPKCGRSLGNMQSSIRKQGSHIAFACPDCAEIVDASEWALEWELLGSQEKTIRLITTALLSYGAGFGVALLVSTLGWVLGRNVGIFKAESLPILSVGFIGFVTVLGLILGTAQFVRLFIADVPGSRKRLEDPKYKKLLVRLDFLNE